jgi:hypothetical protein
MKCIMIIRSRCDEASSPSGFLNQDAMLCGMVLLHISLCHSAESR